MKKKIWIGVGIVTLIAVFVIASLATKEKLPEARVDAVTLGELTEIVTASGRLEPKTSVDVSATIMGKITRMAVEEGDVVQEHQFLLEIDPEEYRSTVRAFESALHSAQEELALANANSEKAALDLTRAERLFVQGLYTEEQMQSARTAKKVEAAQVAAARARIGQAEANLSRVQHDLSKVTINSPLAGIVTRLNVEEGENAIIGTMNNPGTLLLTVADLDTMEAEVEVDETEVVRVMPGQSAEIEVDAYPDTSFAAVVTEVGNSPIFSNTGIGQQAVDFEVVLRLTDSIDGVRPGLSASADITVAHRESCLSIPIASLIVREYPPREKGKRGRRARARRAAAEGADSAEDVKREELEGVFVVGEDGVIEFRPVKVGIAGEERFEVLNGVAEDESVIEGPFRVLRSLQHGDKISILDEDEEAED